MKAKIKKGEKFLFMAGNMWNDIEDTMIIDFSDKYKYIDGILINKFTQTIKQPGSIVIPMLEEGNCMDSFSKREFDARIKIIEEEKRKTTILNNILNSNLEFVNDIEDKKLQLDARFKLFKDDRKILDNTFLADFMNKRNQNDDGDEIDIKGDD